MAKGQFKLNEAQTAELVRLYRVERLSLSQVAWRLHISVSASAAREALRPRLRCTPPASPSPCGSGERPIQYRL
jgi:hypothetical protein